MKAPLRLRVLARAFAFEHGLRRVHGAFDRLRRGFLDEALGLEEKEALGVLLYDASPYNRGASLFRPQPTATDEKDTAMFGLYMGYAHTYRREELEELAASVGRALHLEPTPYAHATFVAPAWAL